MVFVQCERSGCIEEPQYIWLTRTNVERGVRRRFEHWNFGEGQNILCWFVRGGPAGKGCHAMSMEIIANTQVSWGTIHLYVGLSGMM